MIIAAEDITDEQMAFMVRYTSGLICAPITQALCERLELPQMVTNNADPKGTAYTISIDANHESTTTGTTPQEMPWIGSPLPECDRDSEKASASRHKFGGLGM